MSISDQIGNNGGSHKKPEGFGAAPQEESTQNSGSTSADAAIVLQESLQHSIQQWGQLGEAFAAAADAHADQVANFLATATDGSFFNSLVLQKTAQKRQGAQAVKAEFESLDVSMPELPDASAFLKRRDHQLKLKGGKS